MKTPDIYKLLIGTVVPRPIAFVSTVNADGVVNLAPFSAFNFVCSNPPTLIFSITPTPEGNTKDTLRNIEANGEFVVNSANEWIAEPLVHCAAAYPFGTSELEKCGLTAVPSQKVRPPRVKECAAQFECVLHSTIKIGDGTPGSATIVIGRIVLFHYAEGVLVEGKINIEKLKPIARLGGTNYTNLRDIFSLEIPKPR